MLDTINIKSMEADRLIEPEHANATAEPDVSPDRIKRLAASMLDRAGIDVPAPQRRSA